MAEQITLKVIFHYIPLMSLNEQKAPKKETIPFHPKKKKKNYRVRNSVNIVNRGPDVQNPKVKRRSVNASPREVKFGKFGSGAPRARPRW